MENVRDDISTLDEPASASASASALAPASASAEAEAASSATGAPEPLAASPQAGERPDADRHRRDLHASFNDRISYLCKLAALVIALVALATMALGQELPQFVLMGLCLSVALLAIAALQDHHQRRR
ncbi:propionyl-CoA carboxylase subunit beta [Paraeggerthella hongkongensis]|uniref:propionyl-CoA carboxylase subunit beta n=1 Tax=Paraeggerthella hominis TaxID=2897351 RepID=UPI001C105EBA|nr:MULTISPECIES: propionyl-CoA carboxylase subunit beta [Paraeggerthella]MBU5405904.1 propionyl-CoA carboxylase subunit beta [Paraeggerthella hongkongensis]MCD2433751.1 propionyl-CoA carboxylase subunit beta [Paraeggerthella hominis]